MNGSDWARIWTYAITDGVPGRSIKVAAVIGTLLNLINQYDAIFGTVPLNFLKLMLTYVVPYCVATYGAVSMRMRLGR